MLSQTLRLTGGRIWGLQVGRCWASSQADRRRWRRRGDGLWVEGANVYNHPVATRDSPLSKRPTSRLGCIFLFCCVSFQWRVFPSLRYTLPSKFSAVDEGIQTRWINIMRKTLNPRIPEKRQESIRGNCAEHGCGIFRLKRKVFRFGPRYGFVGASAYSKNCI